jgi:putative ABC transport system substrate-binding protein
MTEQRSFKSTMRSLSVWSWQRVWPALATLVLLVSGDLLTCPRVTSGTTRVRLAVIKSLDLPEYNLAFEGFISALQATGYEPVTTVVTLGRGDAEIEDALQSVRNDEPDLILALGTRAAMEISRLEKRTPIVYSMVLRSLSGPPGTGELPSQANVTGANLNIPLRVQLQKIKLAFPTAHRVGVISDPAQTKSLVDSVRSLAKMSDLELRVQWVKNENDIPNAVRALSDSVDVFWMLPDQTVLTPRSSRFIIFELIKAGVPIMGLSSAYVKAGALLALDCNYQDIGRQSGELAVRILAGQPPAQLQQTQPRAFTLAVNMKVREHLRVPLDESVVRDSNVVAF